MRRMARAVGGALGAAWLALAPTGAAAGGVDGFIGNWVRTERERDDAARDAMIERVTEPMSFAFRGFARGVMHKRMVPVEETRFLPVELAAPPPQGGTCGAFQANHRHVEIGLRNGRIVRAAADLPENLLMRAIRIAESV